MKLKHIIPALLATLLFAGCYSEDDIVPSDDSGSVDRFTFPQGDNSWDKDIVDIYNTFGVEIIYKDFTSTDINRAWTSIGSNYSATVPESDAEVEYTVNVLKNHVFRYLTPAITKGVFKPYLYIAHNLMLHYRAGSSDGSATNHKFNGLDSWTACLYWDNGRKTPTTREELFQVRGSFLYEILAMAMQNINIPDEYNEGFDYTTNINSYNPSSDNYYLKRGIVTASNSWGDFYPASSIRMVTASSNFFQYMHLAMYYSDAEIEQRYPRATYPFLRSKLDYVVNYIKSTYNIDLKAIHNGPEE